MTKLARSVDQPIAGLIKDLKSRGMLDDTLVVWTTEFGRTPWGTPREQRARALQQGLQFMACRRRHKAGYRLRLVRRTAASDVAENEVHVHDFHATILHCLGFDHTRLTYRHAGRDFRLTDVHGNVVKSLLT